MLCLIKEGFTMTKKRIKEYLKEKRQTGNNLEKAVARYLLKEDDIEGHIKDILNYGCQSGTVKILIYTANTHKFFLKYYEEIFEILDDIRDNSGEEFSNYKTDRANTLAWLGFEETVDRFYNELKILKIRNTECLT